VNWKINQFTFFVVWVYANIKAMGENIMKKITTISSEVISTTMYSEHLHLDWNYDVYLPAGYDSTATTTYPVLYLLHGMYGNHTDFLEKFNSQKMLDTAITNNHRPIIVVFVDGFNSFYINQNDGLQVEDAIIKDLIPTIDAMYRISPDKEDHAIGGLSMGGYGAARLSLKYSNYFSKALLVSPSVRYELPENTYVRVHTHIFNDGDVTCSDDLYRKLYPTNYLNADSKKVKFCVESTTADSTVLIKFVDQFVQILQDNDVSVKYVRDSGDNHNWTYWGRVAPKMFDWVLKEFKNKSRPLHFTDN